jgi:membrane peptidoglycan carboxypeptidase
MDVKGEIVDGYSVPNADGGQRGPVRVRDALKYSWNIPVAKAQQLIGTENVVAMGERMGLRWDPQQKDNVAVPSLTLGTIGVHMLDLAGAYGVIANGGMRAEPYLIETIAGRGGQMIYDHATDGPKPQRVLSAQAAYLVTDILADNTDPAQNSIWGERFQLLTDEGRRPATLKTGTTNDFRDLQAFGYLAPDADGSVAEGAFITGVWVGNSDFSEIADVFAADGPTFIWHDYMSEVTSNLDLPMRDFPNPGGIVERQVDAISGMLPGEFTEHTVSEIFAESNQPTEQDTIHRSLRIEAETDKIWQEGCGDFETEPSSGSSGTPQPRETVFLDLSDYEDSHPTWLHANRSWISQWRGHESSLGRAPAPPLDAPLAPAELCTPGEIPTSSPTPSATPSPVPTPTPLPTVVPTPTVPPSILPSPSVLPSASGGPTPTPAASAAASAAPT